MPIDRDQLERLLAERPATQRSAMQAVRDGYDDITLMRERGLSWAEISDVLARLGIMARDNNPISPVTLRSAYFLVGNESREDLPPSDSSRRPALEAILAEGRAAKAASDAAAEAIPDPAAEEDSETDAPPAATDPVEEASQPPMEAVKPLNEVVAAVPNDVDLPEGERSELGDATAPETPPTDAIQDSAIPVGDAPDTATSDTATSDTADAVDADPVDADPMDADPIEVKPITAIPTEAMEGGEPPPKIAGTVAGRPREDALGGSPDRSDGFHAGSGGPDEISHAGSGGPDEISIASTNARGHRMLGTIFVLNDRGGVGKTLLSHHLMATAMLEGLELKVVEYEVNERLARLFGPEVVEHRRITQDFMNLMGSGDGFYEFWDQIGPELQRGGRLFDFGGNISQWFFNWAEVSGFDYYVGEGERLTFMVPVTVDLASLSTGMATLDRIAAIAPKANRVLVENGVSGPFNQLEDSQYGRRKAELVEREGVDVISMPPCAAPAWARLTGHRIDQVARMTREDLVKLGMTPPVASRSLIIIHDWLRGMREALAPYVADAFRVTPTPASGRVQR